jgi:6-phosphogluconolactonase
MPAQQWWVGGYGPDLDGIGTGIGLANERADGALEYLEVVAELASPTWLLEHRGHLLAAAEGLGEVHSFRRDGTRLVHDGSVSTGGTVPCHLALAGPDTLIASNYEDGVVGVIDLLPGGAVGELAQTLRGEGSGPRPTQPGPHAHAAFLVDEGTLLTLDLGADRIHVHRVEGGRLERVASVALPAGTGPRDIARHPSGLIYVLGELGGELFAFDWAAGVLELVASVSLAGAVDGDHGAALAFGQGGPFVYTGLRGSDRISIVRTSDDGRDLEAVAWVECEGEWPRHLVARDDVLHVSNQLSHSIASFRLGSDGMPSLIADPTRVPSPAFLLPVG